MFFITSIQTSDKKKYQKYHQDGEERRPMNLSPTRIPKQEYFEDRDMIQSFIYFTSAWENYVTTTFDSALKSIVKNSELPKLPK